MEWCEIYAVKYVQYALWILNENDSGKDDFKD